MNLKKTTTCLAIVGLMFASQLLADQTLLLRNPALSENHLAFVYAGDIWVADRAGGEPRRLTSSPAEENTPVFSPDGSMITFAAAYDGNTDVYVIPVEGGQPQRLTWYPGTDRPQDWTADGSAVAFTSRRNTNHGRSAQLYHAPLDGSFPAQQMEARIVQGKYGPGGELAYIAHGSGYNGLFGGSAGWKGYRGGTTPEILVMDADRESVTAIDGAGVTNFNPFWLDGKVYFLSDRENEIYNLFRWDPADGSITKVSNEPTWDVRSAGGHGATIVYEAGGQLKQLDVASGEVEALAFEIAPDLPQLRPQWKNAGSTITTTGISRSGKRALLTARGEVFTVPVEDGSTRNLSNTGTLREYTALWSPDGQQIAWISETDGGQEVVISNQTGTGEMKRIPLGSHFYLLRAWTGGDKPKLIYTDNHLGLHALDVSSGQSTAIATGARRDGFQVSVSPDGRWLAYTLEQANYHHDLMLLDLESGRSTRVSDGMADVASPAFSPDGKYLYFAASTNSGPLQVGLNMTSQERPYRAALYAAVLSSEEASPLAPKPGDEEAEAKDEDEDKDSDDEDKESGPTRIDLDGLSDRIVALPVAERSYSNLQVGKDGKLYYLDRVQAGASVTPPGERANAANQLMQFDFEEKEAKSLLSAVTSFAISSGGGHMIIGKNDGSMVTVEIKDKIKPETLDLGGVKVLVNPREEWAQMFDEAWRMEKEYFYADNLHGADWDAVYEQYRPLVDHAGRREDLNAIMVEMIAELQAGHNRVRGGDIHRENGVTAGLLGADLSIRNDRYRIDRVYSGESWNPFVKAPLAVPGNEATEGEYILAINGRDLAATDNIYAALEGTEGEQVTLRVGPNANGNGARDIVVEPVDSESALRRWAWIEDNRRKVDAATDGRVGYIYLPNTAGAGYTYFNRMFFSQLDKEALIIDERSNSGGQAANYITEMLGRPHLSGWMDRDGLTYNTPAGAMHGPKLMLIDQDAGSGGDYLPHTFRATGLGKLMGTRTWGGLIGIAANPSLMDGGSLVVPFFRFFDEEGKWSVENEGVAPDIEVRLDPIAYNQGEDSQLDAAIAEIQAQLENYVSDIPEAPPLPTELGE